MGVNHRRLQIAMAQELLDGPSILATFEQMSCERMPTRPASGRRLRGLVRDRRQSLWCPEVEPRGAGSEGGPGLVEPGR